MSISADEHPFTEFIKILGKGKKGSRPLTRDEAYRAMRMILAEEVQPIQLGAFLMLMRIKEETSDELSGFVAAAKQFIDVGEVNLGIDLDWSSYAGKRRHLPWFILSALLLADNGIKVFMHGAGGHTRNRIYTEEVLEAIGIRPARSLSDAKQQLTQLNFSYLSLQFICPKLYEIINLRPILGLRSPVHTLVRLLNPLNASHSIQGIFHPNYRQVHQNAALLLDMQHMAVLKGEGGETERNPDVECLVQSVHKGQLSDEVWPAFFTHRHLRADTLDPVQLIQLWRDEIRLDYAQATITGTTAIALKLLGKAENREEAEELAEQWWEYRNKKLI